MQLYLEQRFDDCVVSAKKLARVAVATLFASVHTATDARWMPLYRASTLGVR